MGHTPLVVGVIVFYVPRKSLTAQKPLILVSFDLKYSLLLRYEVDNIARRTEVEPERREDVTDQSIGYTGCGGSEARPAGWSHLRII